MRQKHTKIVATLPNNVTAELIKKLHDAGMDVARINTAHATLENTSQIIQAIRSVSDRLAILIDTKGPEIRTTAVASPISFTKGQTVSILYGTELTTTSFIFVSYINFVAEIEIGTTILMSDGDLGVKVISKNASSLLCEVQNNAILGGSKNVNVPQAHLKLPSITAKDEQFIEFAIKENIDFIAHSFVRNKHDIDAVQNILNKHKSPIKIIAKIENKEGINNIDEILDNCFGVMVARGDLGVEIPAEEVPLVQKEIIRRGITKARPVIIATQMLESMTNNPRPTRAEVSDVANAVFDGADALMLSGETAKGQYPVEAVQTMARIIKRCESHLPQPAELQKVFSENQVRGFLSKAAVIATRSLPTKAIIVPTESGASARIVSSYRPVPVIYAECFNPRVMRELRLSYGVCSDLIEISTSTDEIVKRSLNKLVDDKRLHKTDLVVVLGVTPGSSDGANFIEINTVERCLQRE